MWSAPHLDSVSMILSWQTSCITAVVSVIRSYLNALSKPPSLNYADNVFNPLDTTYHLNPCANAFCFVFVTSVVHFPIHSMISSFIVLVWLVVLRIYVASAVFQPYSCMPVNPSCVGEPCPTQSKQVVTIPTKSGEGGFGGTHSMD